MAEPKEYIEREAAKRAIYEYICGHTMSKFLSRELLDASKGGAEGAMYELDYVPAADVVEVVRCKDCKHSRPINKLNPPEKYFKDDCIVCECENCVGDEPMVYVPYHFCSYGERKEE